MLKLRRIELIGFKSFSDKGEIVVNDNGVTAIVGPNGCGKSNVSDAIAWVLGEQSAKSLRGEKMEDVIFNGTRNRPPMGMAEVTITLREDSNGNGNGNGNGRPDGLRDITLQRRLYRSGESLYLIDGKPCRLRDIQDIFLGTGLGPNSYAIIEQGRVGQLLSSKPSDRRTLIEEAAGITKFKSKRKLAESRLEAARQNLSRVNDILAEIDRQRNSLKRQAGKARRFIELRNRMRQILSAVFSTQAELLVYRQEKVEIALVLMTGEGKRLESAIEGLNGLVRQRRADVETQERALEQTRERRSDVELEHEKTIQRIERLRDQIQTLEERKMASAEEKNRALDALERNVAERQSRGEQLASIEEEKSAVEGNIATMGQALSDASARRAAEERAMTQLRQEQFETVGREAKANNEISSRKETIARIGAQMQRLDREESDAREQASGLELQLNAAREANSDRRTEYSRLKDRLHEAEQTHAGYKLEQAEAVKAASEARAHVEAIRHRLQTIGELAVQRAYSTESVQQFFNHVRGTDWSPLGILADFAEVEPDYESIVEDVLRVELQYVVVEDRAHAHRALTVVRDLSKGRLDCLVLNGNTTPEPPAEIEGALPIMRVVRFGERLQHFNNYVRNAYIVDSVDRAWELSEQHPGCVFAARTGEVVHGHVIGWGQHEAHGPLSLKREIRELDRKLDEALRQSASQQENVARLEELLRESDALRKRLSAEVQEAEKTLLTMDHRVRVLNDDCERARQRWKVAESELARLGEERNEVKRSLLDAEFQLTGIAARKASIDEQMHGHLSRSEELRSKYENLRLEFAETQSKLAVLQEKKSTALRELNTLGHQAAELEQRKARAEQQIQQAGEQQEQTRAAIQALEEDREELTAEADRLDGQIAESTAALEELRRELHEAETKWDETRGLLDTWKDRHNSSEIEKAQIDSDLKHLSNLCFNELNETIESVCLKYFDALPSEELELREREYRELREKLDSMGAVNMMAVEEYREAEDRFEFLTTQRQDLLDSIRDTTQAIQEIDLVCRRQFKEAFEAVNAGFKESFVSLFGGGHGELRMLEGSEEADAGVEIIAQPPGKKLQNVLLLSGGEKALTALALLIALFRFKPSPFCVLDEVDAPLDDANVDRFAQMVRHMSDSTQFIVITHSKRTMETASTLYGVTMEEPGISKIVSVRLN